MSARTLGVFDLDGTLVDSSRDLAASGNALLASYGAPLLPDEQIVRMVGEGARELVRRLLAAAGLSVPLDEALDRFLALYDERLLDTTRPYDGVVEALDRIAPVATLAVLTNKPAFATKKILEGLGLARYFSEVIGGDEAVPRKPDPAGLQLLMERAGATPRTTILVGDSVTDVRTALAAGVRMCLVSYGFGFALVPDAERAAATWVIERPAQLVGIGEWADRVGSG